MCGIFGVIGRRGRVDAAEVTYEGGLGGNNLSKILDNVNAAAGGTKTDDPNAPKDKKPGKKLQVDEFVVTGAKVKVVTGGDSPGAQGSSHGGAKLD